MSQFIVDIDNDDDGGCMAIGKPAKNMNRF